MAETPRPERCAGFMSRLTAFIVDALLLMLLWNGVERVLTALDGFFRGWEPGWVDLPALVTASLPLGVMAYFVLFWSLAGQTPGKWLLGVKVVGPDGEPPSLVRAALRFLGYFVSALPLYLGFAWILVDPKRRALHDRLSGTYVVYTGPVGKLVLPPRLRGRQPG